MRKPASMRLRLTVALLAAAPGLSAQSQSPQLDPLLKQLDTASAHFKSAQAEVRYDNYTRVVRADTLQSGSMYIERAGKSDDMGAVFFNLGADGKPTGPPDKVLNYNGGVLQVYTPGVNQDDLFKAGASQARYDSFLTLGFGGSGHDLAANWAIQDQGPETLDGVHTQKLDLTPKDPSVANTFKHVTIWIDPTRGVSLKQEFFAPNGDTRTATYTNIRLNAPVNKKPYEISKKAQKIQH